MNHKTESRFAGYRVPLAIALAGCIAVLGACADDGGATSAPKSHESTRSGVLETSLGNYEFKPSTCALFREGDFEDIEIQGPGVAPDGEVFFFELSSTAEELSIHLGVDRAMAHSERTLKAGRWSSEPFAIQASENGNRFTASDIVLVDADLKRIAGLASLEIVCGNP